jgi:hypothetical protein
MKAIVFNSSPKGERGFTELILKPFTEGMVDAGAEVERYFNHRLRINPCLGCYRCKFKTPGKCIHRDDMQDLMPRIIESDIWVFATPVFIGGMNGPMKTLLDRLFPLGTQQPHLVDNRTVMTPRWNLKDIKVCLVSSCGLWELSQFDYIVQHIKEFCRLTQVTYSTAILRPHAPRMAEMLVKGNNMDDIFSAARKAGKSIIENGYVSDDLLKIIAREVMDKKEFLNGKFFE